MLAGPDQSVCGRFAVRSIVSIRRPCTACRTTLCGGQSDGIEACPWHRGVPNGNPKNSDETSSGESGPPCGVPVSLAVTRPSCIMPACRNRRMRPSTRLSCTVRATRAISTSWLTRSKNFSKSMSTTHRRPAADHIEEKAHLLNCFGRPGSIRRARKKEVGYSCSPFVRTSTLHSTTKPSL
jgi:hypothetical protein